MREPLSVAILAPWGGSKGLNFPAERGGNPAGHWTVDLMIRRDGTPGDAVLMRFAAGGNLLQVVQDLAGHGIAGRNFAEGGASRAAMVVGAAGGNETVA